MDGTYRCLHEDQLELIDPEMSNFDHTADKGCEEGLADGNHMCDYAGWNFHAFVYKHGDVYVADVHTYCSHAGYITGGTLKQLMENVSNRYGWG